MKYLPLIDFKTLYVKTIIIGEGSYGSVYLCEDTTSVVKEMLYDVGLIELINYQELNHKNILSLKNWSYDDSGNINTSILYMAFPLGMSIARAITQGLTTIEVAARELFEGLNYLSMSGFLHDDLKIENTLFVENRSMIIDFGIAKRATFGSVNGIQGLYAKTDTSIPNYNDVEEFSDYRDVRLDLYSYATTIYAIYLEAVHGRKDWYNILGNIKLEKTGIDWLDSIIELCRVPLKERKFAGQILAEAGISTNTTIIKPLNIDIHIKESDRKEFIRFYGGLDREFQLESCEMFYNYLRYSLKSKESIEKSRDSLDIIHYLPAKTFISLCTSLYLMLSSLNRRFLKNEMMNLLKVLDGKFYHNFFLYVLPENKLLFLQSSQIPMESQFMVLRNAKLDISEMYYQGRNDDCCSNNESGVHMVKEIDGVLFPSELFIFEEDSTNSSDYLTIFLIRLLICFINNNGPIVYDYVRHILNGKYVSTLPKKKRDIFYYVIGKFCT